MSSIFQEAENSQVKDMKIQETEISKSPGFAALLRQLNTSLVYSSYHSGSLYFVGSNDRMGLVLTQASNGITLGLHVDEAGTLYTANARQIVRFENVTDTEAMRQIDGAFDANYLPRETRLVGQIAAHDIATTTQDGVIFAATGFNCVGALDNMLSFREVWRPAFIDKLIAEDRCHLNGIAVEDGTLRYVTAVSKSNTVDGWRDRTADGGILIDVATNEIVCEGLSMPHSPRMHDGKLWLCNSGTGEFGFVDFTVKTKSKRFTPVTFCPGFIRGLRFAGDYAFVGMSRPRYDRFRGLELDQRLQDADSEPWTGIQVINLKTGTVVQWLRMDGPVAELYDIALIPGVLAPNGIGLADQRVGSFVRI